MSEGEPTEGTRIANRYVIERELGRGATKRVYLAEDALTGVKVAVALLAGAFSGDPQISARFSREARAASALRSPFIVRVYDVGKLGDGTRYLVLEAVLGRGLDEAMSDGAIDPARAARWTLEVLAALCEAHARGVIHRDIKPENVMLAPTPVGELAKLTDFGLAKVVDSTLDASVHLHTAANAVLGTPDYMAPEQWRGSAVDSRTDLYAVGVLLYEMLTGATPFGARELPAVYAGHLFREPPRFDRTLSPMALALEPVVLRALAKQPEERFDNALVMAQAIAAVTGIRVPDEAFALAVPLWNGRQLRAELVGEVLSGPVTVLGSATVVIGRDPSAHECVRCVGVSDAAARERTVSRTHVSLVWRGGRAWVTDLGSTTGTTIDGSRVTSEPVALERGEVLGLGPFVRYRFDHGACETGALPPWATLERVDDAGASHSALLLLGGEATLSAGEDAAIVWRSADAVTLSLDEGKLVLGHKGSRRALGDDDEIRLEDAVVSVAIDRSNATTPPPPEG
ncbi:MAG: protein kinase [Myxococcales bacterium]|nr:protein kinase [Myxococcales bacterium]